RTDQDAQGRGQADLMARRPLVSDSPVVTASAAVDVADHPPLEGKNVGDLVFRVALTVAAVTVPLLLGFLVYELYRGGQLAIHRYGLHFIAGSTWDPVAEDFGAFPLIIGTLVSSLIALLIAVPLSLGVAIFLTEFSPRWLRQPISFLIELLA